MYTLVGAVGRRYSMGMEFLPYFQSRQTELISLLQKLVKLESPSSDKIAVDACSTFMVKQLRDIEARVTCLPQKEIGDLTLAEFPGIRGKDTGDRTLLLAHTDTVWPIGTIRHMPYSIQGNAVNGPGVLDMKSGLVMIIAALQALRKQNLMPRHPIAVFLNSYEEVGNAATDRLIRDAAAKSGWKPPGKPHTQEIRNWASARSMS